MHGRVSLVEDVEALVLDPCYGGTEIEHQAAHLGFPLEWHEGRDLDLAVLDAKIEYRGPDSVRIGHEIAEDGTVDARVISEAPRTGRYEAQALTQLWHLTAQWGRPRLLNFG